VADSTSHAVVAVVLRATGNRLEVLLVDDGLPAATLRAGESLEDALARAVETARLAHLEQLETRALAGGVTTAYLGLVRRDEAGVAGDWSRVGRLPQLTPEEDAFVRAATARLRAKLSYTNLGFALAPSTFTVSELREVYVAALGHDVSATNLQRVLVRRGVLEPVGGRRAPGRTGGRPAALFRFASNRLEVTDEFAALRPPR
jgi:8-oxo-dGTP diphosphatase